MLRIKCLEYNRFGSLEELDLGPVPEHALDLVREYKTFTYSVGDVTYENCYAEFESATQPLTWRLLGYAFILAVTTGAGFLLRIALDVLKSH
jgi:hypothetical protein